jgi:hypothetical protein
MSNKFGLVDDPEDQNLTRPSGLDLSSFAPVKKRAPIDLVEVDAAAAPHGFVSREAVPSSVVGTLPISSAVARPATVHVRRRVARPEPSRSLAVRMVVPEYDRFVAYADRHQLTYHEAIKKLLDDAGE